MIYRAHRSRWRTQRGYSVAEVLTAMAIASIASTLAVPNLVSFSAQYGLSSAADQVAFAVVRTRMRAVGENVFMRVRFLNDSSGSGYWVERSEDGVAYTSDGPVSWLPRQVEFAPVPELLPRFSPRGLGATPSVITLANSKGQTKTIRVNVLGKVKIE